jgi:CheY-like chemotaxis protein
MAGLEGRAPGTGGTTPLALPPRRPRHRVLVVDDNPDSADSLALLLGMWGHDVRVANDGPAALAAAEAHGPDVVLLDIGLPGMSGYDVARALRESRAAPGMIVALTGYGQDEDRRRSLEAGFGHHLVKPVSPAELKQLLDTLPPSAGA